MAREPDQIKEISRWRVFIPISSRLHQDFTEVWLDGLMNFPKLPRLHCALQGLLPAVVPSAGQRAMPRSPAPASRPSRAGRGPGLNGGMDSRRHGEPFRS